MCILVQFTEATFWKIIVFPFEKMYAGCYISDKYWKNENYLQQN